jgi:hypothetical protein
MRWLVAIAIQRQGGRRRARYSLCHIKRRAAPARHAEPLFKKENKPCKNHRTLPQD